MGDLRKTRLTNRRIVFLFSFSFTETNSMDWQCRFQTHLNMLSLCYGPVFLHRMRIFIQRLTERRNDRHLRNKRHFVEELRVREISWPLWTLMTRRRLRTRKVQVVIFRKVRTNLVDEIHYPGIRLNLVKNRIYNLWTCSLHTIQRNVYVLEHCSCEIIKLSLVYRRVKYDVSKEPEKINSLKNWTAEGRYTPSSV